MFEKIIYSGYRNSELLLKENYNNFKYYNPNMKSFKLGNDDIYYCYFKYHEDCLIIQHTTIIYFYGINNCMLDQWNNIEYLIKQGYNVLIADYPGFGCSNGYPTNDKNIKFAEKLFSIIDKNNKIIIYGFNYGTYMASYLAEKYNLECILDGPYYSFSDFVYKILSRKYPHIKYLFLIIYYYIYFFCELNNNFLDKINKVILILSKYDNYYLSKTELEKLYQSCKQNLKIVDKYLGSDYNVFSNNKSYIDLAFEKLSKIKKN